MLPVKIFCCGSLLLLLCMACKQQRPFPAPGADRVQYPHLEYNYVQDSLATLYQDRLDSGIQVIIDKNLSVPDTFYVLNKRIDQVRTYAKSNFILDQKWHQDTLYISAAFLFMIYELEFYEGKLVTAEPSLRGACAHDETRLDPVQHGLLFINTEDLYAVDTVKFWMVYQQTATSLNGINYNNGIDFMFGQFSLKL